MKILIVGLGRTGQSILRFYANTNAEILAVDTNTSLSLPEIQLHCPHAKLKLGEFEPGDFAAADVMVLSPGIDETSLPPTCAQIVTDVDLFMQQVQAPVIGVTGTNGKSTVVSLLGQVISSDDQDVLLGGNIGVPVLDLLREGIPDYYVLELSSFQLMLSQPLALKVAVLLNLSDDHLDRHKTMADYLAAKQRIYANCEYAVVNENHPAFWNGVTGSATCIPFGLYQHDDLPRYMQENIAAVQAVLTALELPQPDMMHALAHFQTLPHRTELVITDDGVTWVDDSKATNVGACVAAIEGFSDQYHKKLIVLLGGDSKDADFFELTPVLAEHAKAVLIYGRDAEKIYSAVPATLKKSQYATLNEVVVAAKTVAQPGDCVLLSPACASWDQYKNYMERGKHFKQLVKSA